MTTYFTKYAYMRVIKNHDCWYNYDFVYKAHSNYTIITIVNGVFECAGCDHVVQRWNTTTVIITNECT